jgi:prepilin-type N-terminal cleavage/methylation domain-containing protein
MSSRRASDEGLTLIEMVVAIGILGFLMAAVTAAITVVLISASPTQGRTAASHDKQLVDAFFGSDVQNSVAVSTTKPACLTPSTSTVNTSVVALTWQDSSGGAATTNDFAWYYVARPKNAVGAADLTRVGQLRRGFCVVPVGSSSPTLVRDIPVSYVVGTATPTLSCVPAAACPGSPRRVAMTVSLGLTDPTTLHVQADRRMTS